METAKIFVLAICVACAAGQAMFDSPGQGFFDASDDSPTTNGSVRIVSGTEAQDGQFAYQVSIRRYQLHQHYCGGAIVNKRFILTAAHCCMGKYKLPSFSYIVCGWTGKEQQGEAYTLDEVIPHPNFDINVFANDIALMKTSREIKFGTYVWPINLPYQNTKHNLNVVVAGWGLPSGNPGYGLSPTLKYVNLKTIDLYTCQRWYEGKDLKANLNDATVCTTSPVNVGTCMGDSGGPLVDTSDPQNKVVCGVVSWGVPCARGYPDVFTRVHSHMYWLVSTMKQTPGIYA